MINKDSRDQKRAVIRFSGRASGWIVGLLALAALIIAVIIAVKPGGISRLFKPEGQSGEGAPQASKTQPLIVDFEGSVAAEGGVIEVKTEGSPLKGLRVEIPADAYPNAQKFKISSEPVPDIDVFRKFTPATPLIKIDNGGAYADKPMVVTLPVSAGEDEFVAPFYFDPQTGELSSVTCLGREVNTVTLLARHFSNIVAVKMSMKELDEYKQKIDTGFLPEVHGWSFTNWGTIGNFLAGNTVPGDCFGMSVASMWFYYRHPANKEKAGLITLGDNTGFPFRTPDFGDDDVRGHILVSQCQDRGGKWKSPIYETFTKHQAKYYDALQNWRNFKITMLATGKPQLVFLDDKNLTSAGHAVVAYAVVPGEDKLLVYDPNTVRTTREIRWDPNDKKFAPFRSALSAAEEKEGNFIEFELVTHVGYDMFIDWNWIQRMWGDIMENGTFPSAILPKYEIYLQEQGENDALGPKHLVAQTRDGQGVALPINSPKFTMMVESADPSMDYQWQIVELLKDSASAIGLPMNSKDAKPSWIDASSNLNSEGKAIYGISVKAKPQGRDRYLWAGFQWLQVRVGAVTLEISPAGLEGTTGTEYEFKAVPSEMPEKPLFEWNFGESSPQVTSTPVIKHSFSRDGQITVRLRLLDAVTKKELAKVSAVANIKPASGRKILVHKAYYGEDKNKPREEYEYYENEQLDEIHHGYYKAWHESGQLALEGNYDEDKRVRQWVSWHSNGQKSSETTYVDGRLDGKAMRWYDNGSPEAMRTYKNDVYDGPANDWDKNGQKTMEGQYREGKKTGKWIMTSPDGKPASSGGYVDDNEEGPWTEWLNEEKSVGNYSKGRKEGVWTTYYTTGERKSQVTYRGGAEVSGSRIEWDKEGKVIRDGE
jgi:antitoxin component YwqK of YwqJK toxin-antitoxin module